METKHTIYTLTLKNAPFTRYVGKTQDLKARQPWNTKTFRFWNNDKPVNNEDVTILDSFVVEGADNAMAAEKKLIKSFTKQPKFVLINKQHV